MIRNVTYTSKTDNTNNAVKDKNYKKEDKTDDTIESKVFQDLGTDTFIKSADDDTANLTYKPVKNKLSAEEITELKEEQANNEKDSINFKITHQTRL